MTSTDPAAVASTQFITKQHLGPTDRDSDRNRTAALDFGGRCIAKRPLPDYPIARIRTGQFIPDGGKIWKVEFPVRAGWGEAAARSAPRAGRTAADCLRGGSAVEFLAMSEALAFDSHQFVKHLTDSGFTEEQAEALATEQVALLNGNLATKAELPSCSGRLKPCSRRPRPLLKASNPTC